VELEAVKCELAAEVLRSAGELRLRVTGSSMLSALWPGDEVIIRLQPFDAVRPGHIVLVARDGSLCVHRVVAARNGLLTTRGDALPSADPPTAPEKVLGVVVSILRGSARLTARSRRCWSHPGTPPKTIRHLFLDQVMPLVLGRMGRAVLHASAVATPDGALAFAGEAGRGKSTLAGAFVNRGASLLTDDCLLLHEVDGAFHVVPSYPGLRLWPDVVPALAGGSAVLPRVCHYSSKGRLQRALPFSSQPLPLRRLYLLAESADGISIAPLTPRDALIELVKCSYVLDVTDRSALKLQFETLSRVAALCLVCRLAYPRDLARLPELHAAITQHANGR